ncbi:16005_t:CDS:2, partial [Gigaspora rosea]
GKEKKPDREGIQNLYKMNQKSIIKEKREVRSHSKENKYAEKPRHRSYYNGENRNSCKRKEGIMNTKEDPKDGLGLLCASKRCEGCTKEREKKQRYGSRKPRRKQGNSSENFGKQGKKVEDKGDTKAIKWDNISLVEQIKHQ